MKLLWDARVEGSSSFLIEPFLVWDNVPFFGETKEALKRKRTGFNSSKVAQRD